MNDVKTMIDFEVIEPTPADHRINNFGIYSEWNERDDMKMQMLAEAAGYRFSSYQKWKFDMTDANKDLFIKLGPFAASVEGKGDMTYIYVVENAIVRVRYYTGCLYLYAMSASIDAANAVIDKLKEIAPPTELKEEDDTRYAFWSGGGGGSFFQRDLEVPYWKDISNNYTEKARNQLAYMMSDNFTPGFGGKLILWSGPAGTGKTTALRALGREWKKWCEFSYILDAESFFGPDASYMMKVLTQETEEIHKNGKFIDNKWNLVILEDAGEFLGPDAERRTTGKALARLLNTVDGLIGQGLKIMVLVTTNEEIGALHPAVTRPGRTAVEIEFNKLSADETVAWCEYNKVDVPDNPISKSLAELYAELKGFEHTVAPKTKIGF